MKDSFAVHPGKIPQLGCMLHACQTNMKLAAKFTPN